MVNYTQFIAVLRINWGVDLLLNCISKDTPPAGKKPAIMGTLPDGEQG